MDLLFVLDETDRGGQSRRRLWSHGSREDRLVVDPAGGDDLHSSASRGLVYGLPISFLLWAVVALAVWAIWLR